MAKRRRQCVVLHIFALASEFSRRRDSWSGPARPGATRDLCLHAIGAIASAPDGVTACLPLFEQRMGAAPWGMGPRSRTSARADGPGRWCLRLSPLVLRGILVSEARRAVTDLAYSGPA